MKIEGISYLTDEDFHQFISQISKIRTDCCGA
jgi:hypothetical protein